MQYVDLVNMLYDAAIDAGVILRFSSDVASVNPRRPTVTLTTGEVISGDVVIGADGPLSLCQRIIENDTREWSERTESGIVSYR